MSFPHNALQSALVGLLQNSITDQAGEKVSVFDDVPSNVSLPYVEVGEYDTETDTTKNVEGVVYSVLWTINVYSEYAGTLEANDIMSQIEDIFLRVIPDGAGFKALSYGFVEGVQIVKESGADDEMIRHGTLRYRWRILKA